VLPGEIVGRWLSWDTAFKDAEQNDATALTVVELRSDYRLLLRHAWWGRLQFPQLADSIREQALRWNADGRLRGIIIEDKASGTSALQTLGQDAPAAIASLLLPFAPGQVSKTGRARQASLWCERGCVLLPQPGESVPWLFDFENLLYKFPATRLKDPLDSLAQAILFLENLLAEGWRGRA
jgi:phage terminase large subunit-like protein